VSDSDILRHVIEVEKSAGELVESTREALAQDMRQLRQTLADEAEAKLGIRRRELVERYEAAVAGLDRQQQAALAAWQTKLDQMPRDEQALANLVRRLLSGESP
jgi:hypothetical protein